MTDWHVKFVSMLFSNLKLMLGKACVPFIDVAKIY